MLLLQHMGGVVLARAERLPQSGEQQKFSPQGIVGVFVLRISVGSLERLCMHRQHITVTIAQALHRSGYQIERRTLDPWLTPADKKSIDQCLCRSICLQAQ